MKVTVTTMTDLVFALEVSDDMELENFKVLCSLEANIAQERMSVFFNGELLTDLKKKLNEYGVKDGDMMLVQQNQIEQEQTLPFDLSTPALSNNQDLLRSYQREAENIFGTLRSNPEQVSMLRVNNPRLAEAFDKGLVEFTRVLEVQQHARANEEQRRIRMLLADPFDSEAQHMIAEEIRRQQIDSNMENAMEYLPESFGEVTMLYINCRVNGYDIKAFVDSGAQFTIINKACAERCNILRLSDSRWSGVALGVGTQKIIGRIHLVQLEINGDFLPTSFMILEHQPMDMLLGLDMLRRYQCTIDLKQNLLRIGTTGTETKFLNENEIPKMSRTLKNAEDSDMEKAIQNSLNTTNASTSQATSQPPSLYLDFSIKLLKNILF